MFSRRGFELEDYFKRRRKKFDDFVNNKRSSHFLELVRRCFLSKHLSFLDRIFAFLFTLGERFAQREITSLIYSIRIRLHRSTAALERTSWTALTFQIQNYLLAFRSALFQQCQLAVDPAKRKWRSRSISLIYYSLSLVGYSWSIKARIKEFKWNYS